MYTHLHADQISQDLNVNNYYVFKAIEVNKASRKDTRLKQLQCYMHASCIHTYVNNNELRMCVCSQAMHTILLA